MNENYIDIELGGWNIPEAITVDGRPRRGPRLFRLRAVGEGVMNTKKN